MYKRYNSQNEIKYKSLNQDFQEEEFLNSFSYVFAKKESKDDIKLENYLYINNHKVCDSTKKSTNNIERKDNDSNRINSKINNLLPLKKDSQISLKDKSKNITYIHTYNENYSSFINNSNRHSHLVNERMECSRAVENKNDLIISSKNSNKIWIRGPYKKKNKNIQKINIDDKCFPFKPGKGLFKFVNKEIIDKDSNNQKADNAKNLFKTKSILSDSNKKLKKIKKRRKFKSDDIRKKIKTQFHKALKNIINRNLKDANSQELFGFLPQTFIGNISKEFNKKYMDITYKELILIDFTKNKENSKNSKRNKKQAIKNQIFLEYLENNPEISKKSGFDFIKNMKYRELLQLYFLSEEFENTIIQLKNKKESDEYINDYIYLSQNYINYFCDIQ